MSMVLGGCGASSDPCANDPLLCTDAGLGTCTGQCVNMPMGWMTGYLVWLGPEGSTLPTCPMNAPQSYPGYADTPPATVVCPPCTCSASTGSCLLSSPTSANGAKCPGDPSKVIPFDAPATWDGKCTAMDPVPSASSFLASPPYMQGKSTCYATDAPPIEVADGKTRALVCSNGYGLAAGECPYASDTCALNKVQGFLFCVARLGDQQCPDGWPEKHLEYDDSSQCGCNCGAPTGDLCTTTLTVYADTACSMPVGSTMLSSDQAQVCVDTTPGSPYGSKSSSPLVYQSGTCTPIPSTSAVQTLCCQP